MSVVIPNYGLALICIETMILWFIDIGTGWANRRRSRRLVLVVCTSVLLTMQVGLAYDLQSYYQGEIGYKGPLMGLPVYDENSDIQPGESLRIGTISNFYR